MVRQPLDDGEEVVVVIGGDSPPRHEAHLGHALELCDRRGHPIGGRRAADLLTRAEEGAAELVLLVGQDHPRAGAPGGERRGEAGRPPARDQHVAMGEQLGVAVGVGQARRPAEARGPADEVFVLEPEALRPHEGLVVEAGGQKPGEQVGDGAQVELDARPAVDALGREPLVELGPGGLDVGLGTGARFELDQGIGLLHPGGVDAARPVVLEAAPDHAHAARQQRRGQGVAGEAGQGLAVEGEGDRPRPVDAPTFGEAVLLHAQPPSPFAPGSGFASPVR